MPEVQALPPGPAPAQLTARRASNSLQDHLQGFLAANNTHGFLPDDAAPDGPMLRWLAYCADNQYVTLRHFKKMAHRIKTLAQGAVKNCHCLELLAAVYGYRTYAELKSSMGRGENIINRRYQK